MWDSARPPELYLLFSVDVESATKFKFRTISEGGRATWGPFFLDFFQSFPDFLNKEADDLLTRLGLSGSSPGDDFFTVWKTLGDEIVFWRKLERGIDATVAIHAATCALRAQTALFAKNGQTKASFEFPSQIKATAWLAGFPVKNMVIDDYPVAGQKEFIGPSIDLGFRLAQLAAPHRMVISPSLAWLLATMEVSRRKELKGMQLHFSYLGRQSLKGIGADGTGYPIFWVNLARDAVKLSACEQQLLESSHIQPDQVIKFCEEDLFARTDTLARRPFIVGDDLFGFELLSPEERNSYQAEYRSFLKASQPAVGTPPATSSKGDAASGAEFIPIIDVAIQESPSP